MIRSNSTKLSKNRAICTILRQATFGLVVTASLLQAQLLRDQINLDLDYYAGKHSAGAEPGQGVVDARSLFVAYVESVDSMNNRSGA